MTETSIPPITTADRDKLTELAARVEAGDGNDTHLNAEIGFALQWEHCDQLDDGFLRRNGYGFPAPFWTSSLDAVVALIAGRLPAVKWCVGYSPYRKKAWAWLESEDHPTATDGPTTASRALLSSFLRAIAAQQDRQTEG